MNVGANDTINPGVPVNLTVSFGGPATGISIEDDGVRGPFAIGFDFMFFGRIYSQFYIGANGWISFIPNPNAAGHRDAFSIPSADIFSPKNCILGPFQDFKPDITQNFIFYLTLGDSLSHRLVVMWCQTPMVCSDSLLVTLQIILNEGSNTIENHIMRKPACPDPIRNKATQGVQNETGFIGYAVPGRNATSWTAANEAWQYTPVSIDSFAIAPIPYNLVPIIPEGKIVYSWYQGDQLLSSEPSYTVTPNETTDYRVVIKLCQGDEFTDTVRVVVIPFIPNAFSPNDDGLNDEFRILGLPPENITKYNFQIYDRWGMMLFSTNDITRGWDGNFKGKRCPASVYAWVVIYEHEKKQITNKGTVMLIR